MKVRLLIELLQDAPPDAIVLIFANHENMAAIGGPIADFKIDRKKKEVHLSDFRS